MKRPGDDFVQNNVVDPYSLQRGSIEFCLADIAPYLLQALEGEGGPLENLQMRLSDHQLEVLVNDEASCGETLPLLATFLASMKQRFLLDRIISLPNKVFNSIDFNAFTRSQNNVYCGASVAWMAAFLARINQPALLNRLLQLPNERFSLIDFSSAPVLSANAAQNKTLAWMAAVLAARGQPVLLKRMLSVLTEDKFLATSYYDVPECISRIDEKAMLVCWSVYLALGQQFDLLDRLLSLPDEQFKTINFHGVLFLPRETLIELYSYFKRNADEAFDVEIALWRYQEFVSEVSQSNYQIVVESIEKISSQFSAVKERLLLALNSSKERSPLLQWGIGEKCQDVQEVTIAATPEKQSMILPVLPVSTLNIHTLFAPSPMGQGKENHPAPGPDSPAKKVKQG
jgi:hypothetical protein